MTNNVRKRDETREADTAVLFAPTEAWNYAHHPFLTVFNGQVLAMWSCGRHEEDAFGQRVMIARSTDGIAWSPPEVLLSPADLGDANGVLTACGFYAHGGRLVAYVGRYRYRTEAWEGDARPATDRGHTDTALFCMTSRDGRTFDPPQPAGVPAVLNHPPFTTSTGRLILCGNVMFPYSDDPGGTGPFTLTGIYGDAFGDGPPFDDSDSINLVTARRGWQARLLCEGSCFGTDDGVLHMMLRSNTDRMWETDSTDNGETWSEPFRTDFSTDGSKFWFSRLSDGRFLCVGNPAFNGRRDPLTLMLSENGVDFDTHIVLCTGARTPRYPGRHKGGLYAYPHAVERDGRLLVVYSVNKESIEVKSVNL